ncbi:uncharacterized protein LOC126837077 isoform X2 [Adelges cooleyi]|uniref:uncharacterized protein LOC126837077 isoform X2 n=1 Tax=Adelges cooleyi TaxID=133065 RepID=UPI0021800554|nr:uncharacterized protein LOC126837077 isoform X2 [Adelges cooleyi]
MYFKYANIFLFLFCFYQVANAARFTDEQLREIYYGTKAFSLRQFKALNLFVGEYYKNGIVHRFEVRNYLSKDKKYEKYQLTPESMLKITEEFPPNYYDISFEEFKEFMNRVDNWSPLTNEAEPRFTDEQLQEIYDGTKEYNLRKYPRHSSNWRVNMRQVQEYLSEDKKYEKYQLTHANMLKITEELGWIYADVSFDYFKVIMNRVIEDLLIGRL